MADHVHGEMDVTSQQEAFSGFIKWVIRVSLASIAVLIFLAIYNS